LSCRASWDCSFKGEVEATVALRMASRSPDSALVLVATRRFLPSSGTYRFAWQSLGRYEVRLVRRNGEWIVVSSSIRAES
jgi:hypothetical protein